MSRNPDDLPRPIPALADYLNRTYLDEAGCPVSPWVLWRMARAGRLATTGQRGNTMSSAAAYFRAVDPLAAAGGGQ